jgi:FMN phosphatase YigB (HAD superfamily)
MPITVVFFDVGETLVNEARLWAGWAAYLGVPVETFLSTLEEVIAAGEHHRRVFDGFVPGFDLDAARRDRAARNDADIFTAADLYPDVIPCFRALRQRGYTIGIAGNQPASAEQELNDFALDVDIITSSASLGVDKPSPVFFERLAKLAGAPAVEIAHVGDRLDNDVLPARESGMISVLLERGPWGRAHAGRAEARLADLRIKSLVELPDALARVTHR